MNYWGQVIAISCWWYVSVRMAIFNFYFLRKHIFEKYIGNKISNIYLFRNISKELGTYIYIFFFSKSKIKTTTVWGRIELFRCLISMEYIKLWSWNTCSLFLSIFLDFFKFWNLENVDVKFIISFPRERWKLNSIWWHQRKLKNTRRD